MEEDGGAVKRVVSPGRSGGGGETASLALPTAEYIKNQELI